MVTDFSRSTRACTVGWRARIAWEAYETEAEKKCIASWTGRGSGDRYFGGADWRPMALLIRVLLNSAGPRKHFSRLHTADCSDRELGAIVAFWRCVRAPVIRK